MQSKKIVFAFAVTCFLCFQFFSLLILEVSAQFAWTKFDQNPISFETGAGSFSVMLDKRVYKMWYSSPDGNYIKYATSSDGIIWNIQGLVVSPGPASWEALSTVAPTVVYNGSMYLMWYRGYPYHGGPEAYGLATSPDGISWTKYSGNPVLNPGSSGSWDDYSIGGATVLFDGSTYRMWYHATSDGQGNDIGYASSANGISWQKYSGNPVIKRSAAINWDSSWNIGISGSAVVKEGTTFRIWYASVNTQFGNWRIGTANSTDGINWGETMLALNPSEGQWDRFYVGTPAVNKNDDAYTMWYIGDTDGQLSNSRIGVALPQEKTTALSSSTTFPSTSTQTPPPTSSPYSPESFWNANATTIASVIGLIAFSLILIGIGVYREFSVKRKAIETEKKLEPKKGNRTEDEVEHKKNKEEMLSDNQLVPKIEYYSCFVSYGEPDHKFAVRLAKDLKRLGVDCWVYPIDSTPGEKLWKEIKQKMAELDKVIIICSAKSLLKDGFLKEIEEQVDINSDKLIPVSLDNLWKENGFPVKRGQDLKPFLLSTTYVDFSVRSKDKYEKSLERLLTALRIK